MYKPIRAACLPNFLAAKIPVKSALNIPHWREVLTNYHDHSLVDLLAYGWPADYTADHPPTPHYRNHVSDPLCVLEVMDFITKEIEHDAIIGPFDLTPFHL